MNGRTWQVAIVGTFDVENYGDLLFPIIAQAELSKRLGAVHLQRFSYNSRPAEQWPYPVTSLSELPGQAEHLDGLLIGGGFLIRFDKLVAEGYGPASPSIHHPTGYWLTPALIALQHATPVIWNAPGMHCNNIPEWAAPLVKLALEQSQYVRVRDNLSRDALAALSSEIDIEVLPDTAFGLPDLIDEQQPSRPFIHLCEQAGLTGPYIVIHAIHVIEPFLRLFEQHPQAFEHYQFLVLPIGPVLGDDPSIVTRHLPHAISLPFWPEPLLLAEILSQAQAVIGHSYHLAISALAFGVPVFCSADLTAGKYTALADFKSLHALPDVETIDARWFLDRAGKTRPCAAAQAAAQQVNTHWDQVATIIKRGKTSSAQALDAFWQGLPILLETAAEHRDTPHIETAPSVVDTDLAGERAVLHARLSTQQQQITSLNQRLAQSEAKVLELQDSSSFRITAPLRSIARGLRTLRER
jgi:lipopolysaccharide transport system ATP-binding protein